MATRYVAVGTKRRRTTANSTRARYGRNLQMVTSPGISIPPRLRGYVRSGGSYGRFGGRSGELKFWDTRLDDVFDSTGEVLEGAAPEGLNLIPQGTGESERIGKRVTIKSIYIIATVGVQTGTASSVGNGNVCLTLIQDTQANGAYPAYTDIFETSTGANTFLNLNNSQRFKTLKRWILPINCNTVSLFLCANSTD